MSYFYWSSRAPRWREKIVVSRFSQPPLPYVKAYRGIFSRSPASSSILPDVRSVWPCSFTSSFCQPPSSPVAGSCRKSASLSMLLSMYSLISGDCNDSIKSNQGDSWKLAKRANSTLGVRWQSEERATTPPSEGDLERKVCVFARAIPSESVVALTLPAALQGVVRLAGHLVDSKGWFHSSGANR